MNKYLCTADYCSNVINRISVSANTVRRPGKPVSAVRSAVYLHLSGQAFLGMQRCQIFQDSTSRKSARLRQRYSNREVLTSGLKPQ